MIRWLLKGIIVLTILLFAYSFASAKMRIAVMDFEAKNISKQTANMVSELIRTEMINTGKFVVIERAQMDEILKEQGFQQTGCTDVSCAVQVGKMLSANKMLVGTVMTLGSRIVINGRIVDVEKGVGEFGEKQDAKSESDLYDAVSQFVGKLSKRIGAADEAGTAVKTEKAEEKPKEKFPPIVPKYGITAAGSYLLAQGQFSKMSKAGFGGNLGFNMNFNKLVLMISGGFYIFDTVEDWIDSVQCVDGSVYAGYSISLTRSIIFTPSAGAGILAFMVGHDERGFRPAGDYEFTSNTYIDPHASVRLELDYLISSSFQVALAPVYTFFFEKSSNSRLLGGQLGIKYCF